MKLFLQKPQRENRLLLIPQGFTLIELLCVVAIISILVSLLIPEIEQVRNRTLSVQCAANLKQLGLAVNLYLGDHDNTFPYIVPTQTTGSTQYIISPYANQPQISNTQTLQQAFSPYVQTQPAQLPSPSANDPINKLLQCPGDMIKGANSNYVQYGVSYMWVPLVDGDVASSPTIARRGGLRVAVLSKLRLMTDFTPVHKLNAQSVGTTNVLYADGHVIAQ